MAQVQVQQITRISPCKITNGDYAYEEEIIVGADALRYRNGKKKNSCVMGLETQAGTDNQVVIGQYNAISTDALFVIGSGTSTSSKKNIVEVKNNKVIINGDLSVGNHLTVNSATINETLKVKTIEEVVSITASTIQTNSITASTIQTSSIINANGVAYTTIPEVQDITGLKNYTSTAHLNILLDNYYYKAMTYNKEEIDKMILNLNQNIAACHSWFDDKTADIYAQLNEIEGCLNTAIDIINQLCENVIWLGKNPSTKKTFSFSVLRPLT